MIASVVRGTFFSSSRILVALGTVWLSGTPCVSIAQDVAELTESSRTALAQGRYAQALKTIDGGLRLKPNESETLLLQFYKAAALQQLARDAEKSDKPKLLTEAAELYTVYLHEHPGAAGATNNLASVYEQLGWPQQAVKLYEEAAAANDSNRGLYLQNYASLLVRLGHWQQAKLVHKHLLKEQPLSLSEYRKLAVLYGDESSDSLVGYLWGLFDTGAFRSSARISLETLDRESDLAATLQVELLTIVIAALARMEFSEKSTLVESLNALTANGSIAGGISEASDLHKLTSGILARDADGRFRSVALATEVLRERLSPEFYQWWWERSRRNRDPDRGVWPADAFRALIRSYGEHAKEIAKGLSDDEELAGAYFEYAESYFRFAAGSQSWEVDPLAVRELVRLKVEKDELGEVAMVLDEYQDRLFAGKGGAIRSNQLKKTFEYHKTLGELYAQLSIWGDSSSVQSAVFQLEHARSTSREIDDQKNGDIRWGYRFTPEMVDMLDSAYKAVGDDDAGERLRIEEAEYYRAQGDYDTATEVLAPIAGRPMSNEDLQRRFETASSIDTVTPNEMNKSNIVDLNQLVQSEENTVELRWNDANFEGGARPTEDQAAAISQQLQRLLDSPALIHDVKAWSDTPDNLKSIDLYEDGRGKLTLEHDGKVLEVPFEKAGQ